MNELLVVILKCKLRSRANTLHRMRKTLIRRITKTWWLCSTQFSGQQGQQLFNQPLIAANELATLIRSKERITDPNQAKEVGQLRSERIREIVSSSVFQVASEFKSSQVTFSTVKDAVSAVIENCWKKVATSKKRLLHLLRELLKVLVVGDASLLTKFRQKLISYRIEYDWRRWTSARNWQTLVDIEEEGKDRPPTTKASIESAVNTLKKNSEVALMKNAMPNFKLKQQFYELTWRHAMEGATRKLRSI